MAEPRKLEEILPVLLIGGGAILVVVWLGHRTVVPQQTSDIANIPAMNNYPFTAPSWYASIAANQDGLKGNILDYTGIGGTPNLPVAQGVGNPNPVFPGSQFHVQNMVPVVFGPNN